MKEIRIAKVTLNIGAGKDEGLLKRGLVLLGKLSPLTPIKTVAKKRIPTWGLRPGLAIGAKVTVRKDCEDLLKRLLVAKDNELKESCFDSKGNFSFGIPEYIDIEGLENVQLGKGGELQLKILGLEVAVTLEKPGFRIKRRKFKPSKIGTKHMITKSQAIDFVKGLGVEVVE